MSRTACKFLDEEAETSETVTVIPTTEAYGVETGVDIDKLAYAVAMAETGDCTKGYGAQYNNCFGLKNGSIVPCETGTNRMCIFSSKEEAYNAFKKVWLEGYGDRFPTMEDAEVWTGGDRKDTWLNAVKKFYYNN